MIGSMVEASPKKRRKPRYEFIPRAKGTSPEQQAGWRDRHAQPIDLDTHRASLMAVIEAIRAERDYDGSSYTRITRRLSREGHPHYTKDFVRRGYLALVESGNLIADEELLRRLTINPVRTLSGVAPVTVLSKPDGCPGRCIFCPDDVQMPKS